VGWDSPMLEMQNYTNKLVYPTDYFNPQMYQDANILANYYLQSMSPDQAIFRSLQEISNKDYSASPQNASALNAALGGGNAATSGSPNGQQTPSLISQLKSMKPDELQTTLSSLLKNNQNTGLSGSLASAVTGNAFSNLGGNDDSDSFAGTLGKGLKRSIAGKTIAAASGESYDSFKKLTALKGSPGFAKKVVYDITKMAADAPIMASSFLPRSSNISSSDSNRCSTFAKRHFSSGICHFHRANCTCVGRRLF